MTISWIFWLVGALLGVSIYGKSPGFVSGLFVFQAPLHLFVLTLHKKSYACSSPILQGVRCLYLHLPCVLVMYALFSHGRVLMGAWWLLVLCVIAIIRWAAPTRWEAL